MGIPQDIITFHLHRQFAADISQCPLSSIDIGRPLFYSKQDVGEGHVILIDSNDLGKVSRGTRRHATTLFVCYHEDDTSRKPSKSNAVYLASETPVQEVFNFLQELFDIFASWETDMQSIYYAGGSFKEMVDRCDSVFFDPFCILDQDLRYVAFSEMSYERGLVNTFVEAGSSLPRRIVEEHIAVSKNDEIKHAKHAFMYNFSYGSAIIKNLFYQDKPIGRIVIQGNYITDSMFIYYRSLLELLGPYIERLYGRYNSFDRDETVTGNLQKALINTLTVNGDSNEDWVQLFREVGWDPKDGYQVVFIRQDPRTDKAFYPKYIIDNIESRWTGVICIEPHDQLILLVNRNKFSDTTNSEFYRSLKEFLHQNSLVAGLSRVILDMKYLNSAYDQTSIALSIGIKHGIDHLYYLFDEYALEYLVSEGTKEFSAQKEMVCSEKLLKLIESDRQKKTGYFSTLKAYFAHRFNASAAAKALFIHRSSFLGRMERIEELIDIDFDSQDEILYLSLSFQILSE